MIHLLALALWIELSAVSALAQVPAGCVAQTITAGQTVSGSLAATDCLSMDGNYYSDYYTFAGISGQQISLTMTSPSIDTYLKLWGPNGSVVAEDDDSAGNLNSRIPPAGRLTLSTAGTYTIEATSFSLYETGTYLLQFDSVGGPAPAPIIAGPFRFVAVTPCRVMDTRDGTGKTGLFGPPFLAGNTSRDVPVPAGTCEIPANARGYSVNITVLPKRTLSFLTIWPSGQPRPLASTLNSFDGKIVSNAAVVPAGTLGGVSIYVTDDTDVFVDINGYLTPP